MCDASVVRQVGDRRRAWPSLDHCVRRVSESVKDASAYVMLFFPQQ